MCTSLGVGETGEDPGKQGENMQTPRTQWLQPEIDFFPHQQYNKTVLNKMTFFKDLLCTYIFIVPHTYHVNINFL